MYSVGQYWNPKQAELKQMLKEGKIEEVKTILYELHSFVHSANVYEGQYYSYLDEILEGLSDKAFRIMPSMGDNTIIWNLWHITRIEDITANILIAKGEQVLDDNWLVRLNTSVKDTGNAMSGEEINSFSCDINTDELINYRNAVGARTKQIIANLKQEDLKRRFSQKHKNKILSEGGVVEHPQSIWLLDFWSKKNVAGILMMPITRHQIAHLNDCKKLKAKCSKLVLL
ncbi:MAG: DinB family protein [Crenarchaeota archaeon]|nr:DinB family protein [Thermoproteota archaeon]